AIAGHLSSVQHDAGAQRRRRTVRPVVAIALIAALAAGCGHVPVQKRFDAFRTEVHDRTGQPIEWMNVTAPESEVVARVENLLKDNLTTEEAVQIALLNN